MRSRGAGALAVTKEPATRHRVSTACVRARARAWALVTTQIKKQSIIVKLTNAHFLHGHATFTSFTYSLSLSLDPRRLLFRPRHKPAVA